MIPEERSLQTAHVTERLMPELLDRRVSKIGDAELFAFRNLRARDGRIIVEVVKGVKRERRVPARASRSTGTFGPSGPC